MNPHVVASRFPKHIDTHRFSQSAIGGLNLHDTRRTFVQRLEDQWYLPERGFDWYGQGV